LVPPRGAKKATQNAPIPHQYLPISVSSWPHQFFLRTTTWFFAEIKKKKKKTFPGFVFYTVKRRAPSLGTGRVAS
jgi:hypothetical protein